MTKAEQNIFEVTDLSAAHPLGVCDKCAVQAMVHTPTGAVSAAAPSPVSLLNALHVAQQSFRGAHLKCLVYGINGMLHSKRYS